jgi:hypothetical protein
MIFIHSSFILKNHSGLSSPSIIFIECLFDFYFKSIIKRLSMLIDNLLYF